jgi:putative ABC transport system ATP-binding protein
MRDNPSFIKVTHLSKQVTSGENRIVILSDIDLDIKTGESVAIQGTSGSGKTTLLTLLAGLDIPTSGDIYLQEHHLSRLDEEERATLRGQLMGFVFQSFQLLNTLTALENVLLPLEIHSIPHKIANERAIHWLNKVGLNHRVHHYPPKLSGGEQQRVAIARAFVMQPKVIFADEMTGNLDTQTGEKMMDILFSLNQQEKTTLVLVTHDVHLAERCDRRLLLREGVLQLC